jgi:hypothetical protein
MTFGRTRRIFPGNLGLSIAAVALAFCLAPASASAAVSGPQLLTFDNYEPGTTITNQYEGQGMLFSGGEAGEDPEIREDGSNPTSPVLGGYLSFYSPIHAQFVVPGTTTPATVSNLSLDVGLINNPGSTQVVVSTTTGPITLVAEEFGINTLSTGATNITGFSVEAVEEEEAGFAIDNVAFTVPPPPPPPPPPPAPACPKYIVYDSRGSGEDKGKISNPGREFLKGFKERLSALHASGGISETPNPYDAVGVFSWRHFSQDVNGLGAFLGIHQLGAYHDSEKEGKTKVRNFVTKQIMGACGSQSKLVLLGYSQGAQATADAYQELSRGQRTRIAAVVLWGDPLYNHDDHAADRDSRAFNGSLGRRDKFEDGSKVFSYCNTHDPICQSGLAPPQLAYYRLKEHSLYWTTDEAKNDGSAVASFLAKGH